MTSEPIPYPPGDEERERYYYGFSGNPRLVARTSGNLWSKPMHKHGWPEDRSPMVQTSKKYAAIVEHELSSKWTKELSLAIIRILDRCAWSYFFPIRIGLEDTPDRECQRPEFSTVLLVAVEEDSLQWEDAIGIASKCRDVLRIFQILDIEVEIREGRYQHYGASTSLEAQIDPTSWDTPTNKAVLPMLSSLGYSIAYLEDQPGAGTVGLHLKLGDEKAVYALICRHFVKNDRNPHTNYNFSEAEQHPQYYAHASNYDFNKCLRSLEFIQEDLEAKIQPLADKKVYWDEWYSHEEDTKHKPPTEKEINFLQYYQFQAVYNSKILELVKTLDQKIKRKIGQLAFLPTYLISSRLLGYLKDWALVLLDPGKFVADPENKVFIGGVYPGHLKPWFENVLRHSLIIRKGIGQ
jgi:hypothetical protein